MPGQSWVRRNRKNRTARAIAAAVEPLEERRLLSQSVDLFGSTPALFVENQGQWADEQVRYAAATRGANVGLTDTGLTFQLLYQDPADPSEEPATQLAEFSAHFLNANPVTPTAGQQPASRFNYFLGEQSNWRSEVPGYEQVVYEGLYPGIALHVQPQQEFLKYEFHVSAGSDFSPIALRYEGLTSLELSASGDLLLTTPAGTLTDKAPLIWQEIGGQRVDVAGEYVLLDEQTFGFRITGAVDERYELIIDPELVWSTYVGGSKEETGAGIAVDGSGAVYVTGTTHSSGWVSGGWDTSYAEYNDAFVAKLTSTGGHVWSTYLGGSISWDDRGQAIAVDSSGAVYVTGSTDSAGWASGGFDTILTRVDGGVPDAFVAKLSSTGAHIWSTYIGEEWWDYGYGIAVDGLSAVYVTGTTSCAGWASGGFDTTYNGSGDAFVVKLGSDGSHIWSTYIGGAQSDEGNAIAVDGSGSVIVAGSTGSSGWAAGGFDTTHDGLYDAFVVKLDTDGNHIWSTYFGGTGDDRGAAVAVDPSGAIYATGYSGSSGWISNGYDLTRDGSIDAYAIKLDGDGGHVWSTYIGGEGDDYGYGIAVDAASRIHVTGKTSSSGWVSGGYDTSYNALTDAFVARLDSDGGHVWSTYLGGSSSDTGQAIAPDGSGGVYVSGTTSSTGWVSGGFDTSYNNYGDAFVGHIDGAPDTTAPGVESNLAAAAGEGQAQLTWSNPAAVDFAGVIIVRCDGLPLSGGPANGVTYSVSQPVGSGRVVYAGNGTSFIDTNLQTGLTYFYALYTFDEVPNYSAAAGTLATPVDLTPPGPVSGLTAVAGEGHAQLTWANPANADFAGILVIRRAGQAPSSGPISGTTYYVSQSLGSGTIVYTGSVASFNSTGLTNGTAYHYAVYAYDAARNYSTAAAASATPVAPPPDLTPPAPVSGLTALAGNAQVQLIWTNPADSDFAGVLIIRRAGQAPSAGPVDGIMYPLNQPLGGGTIIYSSSGTSHTSLNLANGTTYHYSLYAYDAARNYSAIASTSATPAAPAPPPALSITGPASIAEGHNGTTTATFTVSLSSASDQTVTVQFTTADGSAIADSDYLPASGSLTFDPGQTSHIITVSILGDLEIETDETFLVRLLNVDNATLTTSEAAATIADDDQPPPDTTPPAPITGLAISAANGQIGLTGASPADAAGILIVRREWLPPQSSPAGGASYAAGQSLGESLIVYAGPAASFVDISALPGVTYHYALYAFDAALNYSAAASTSATLPVSDLTAPFAKLAKPPAVKAGKTPYRFKVSYTDTLAVSALSLGHRNVLVTGPRKFKQWARLIARTPALDAASIVATYQITAPGKTWGSEDSGIYTVWIWAGQVRDVSGNAAAKKKLGTLKVAMKSGKAAKAEVFATTRPARADALPASLLSSRPWLGSGLFRDGASILDAAD